MIKKLCLILCVIIAMSATAGCTGSLLTPGVNAPPDTSKINQDFTESNSIFAFNIFRQLNTEDENRNIFISPLSISTALSMTYMGAGTTTKEAMAKALEYTGADDEILAEGYRNLIRYLSQLDNKIELDISNSLWIREGEQIKEAFLSGSKDIFNASINYQDFSAENAADTINQWISGATKGKIKKLLEPPISPDVIMYLINAIYFKGDWKYKFDEKNTSDALFNAGNGLASQVRMMSKKGKAGYMQGEGFKAVSLPYGSGNTAMYCILPDENVPVNKFIADLDESKWREIQSGMAEANEVEIKLPRFKLEYGVKNLNDSLTALGMGEAFSDQADFSGIRNDICISRVLHKAVIDVNEEGSEAAAVTGVEMQAVSASEPLSFIADRPFIFIIVDDTTGTILFMGKAYNL